MPGLLCANLMSREYLCMCVIGSCACVCATMCPLLMRAHVLPCLVPESNMSTVHAPQDCQIRICSVLLMKGLRYVVLR